ncbi:MAG TPA: flagellar hook-length control protein FliK [Acidobacteriota bacterium]|nr:flagellar hook-length control protein FliK [Acidobacteriota bacterium]
MKTSDVSSNRPVQSGGDKTARSEQKPKKEFDKVLDDGKGQKKSVLGKQKPFSPLSSKAGTGEKKTAYGEKKDLAEARAEGKSQKQGTGATEHRDYDRIEARGQKEHKDGDVISKESSKDALSSNPQPQQVQPQMNVQQASEVKATQRPGLNINEIQSIVNKCELAVNDKGKPEFRFELQTKNLGNIDLKVSTEDNKVNIEFATQDVQTQEVLRENLKELGEMLHQKGLMLAEMKFEQRGQDSEKQEKERERQEQASDDISPIEGGPRRRFSLS